MKIGDRVITSEGEIGIVTGIDGDFTDIRYVTPNNEPSCVTGTVWTCNLRIVGENVLPLKKNKEWWDKANSFHNAICSAINEVSDD